MFYVYHLLMFSKLSQVFGANNLDISEHACADIFGEHTWSIGYTINFFRRTKGLLRFFASSVLVNSTKRVLTSIGLLTTWGTNSFLQGTKPKYTGSEAPSISPTKQFWLN